MTTPMGVNEDGFLSDDDAAESLLARWADAEKPSRTDEGKTSKKPREEEEDQDDDLDFSDDEDSDDSSDEEDDSSDTDQSDDDAGDDEDDNDDTEAPEATDGHKVTVTVDGETKTVTVKELKRLFGQEASLTRKSQEVATARKAADADGERYMIAAQKMITKAEDRFKPFENIDWMVAQTKLTPEEFSALRSEAKAAYDDMTFLRTEADDVLGTITKERQQATVVAAREAIKTLEADIPGWNQDVYNRVLNHAVSSGMDPKVASSIVDASSIKLLHQAMRYTELKAKATQKKTKQKAAPKRVIKSSNRSSTTIGKTDKGAKQMDRLRSSGSIEDAAEALMSRWRSSDGDD